MGLGSRDRLAHTLLVLLEVHVCTRAWLELAVWGGAFLRPVLLPLLLPLAMAVVVVAVPPLAAPRRDMHSGGGVRSQGCASSTCCCRSRSCPAPLKPPSCSWSASSTRPRSRAPLHRSLLLRVVRHEHPTPMPPRSAAHCCNKPAMNTLPPCTLTREPIPACRVPRPPCPYAPSLRGP